MDRFEFFKNLINIAVKTDDTQYNKFVDKKAWSEHIPKNILQLKKILCN